MRRGAGGEPDVAASSDPRESVTLNCDDTTSGSERISPGPSVKSFVRGGPPPDGEKISCAETVDDVGFSTATSVRNVVPEAPTTWPATGSVALRVPGEDPTVTSRERVLSPLSPAM